MENFCQMMFIIFVLSFTDGMVFPSPPVSIQASGLLT